MFFLYVYKRNVLSVIFLHNIAENELRFWQGNEYIFKGSLSCNKNKQINFFSVLH